MRTLYLMRHAKSDWSDTATDDRLRPLNRRGRRAAQTMALHLKERGIRPEVVLSSTARRAVETLEAMAPDLEGASEVDLEEDLYLASASSLADRLRALPPLVNSVMLIGHNPGMYDLALDLAGAGPALPDLQKKFPTAALVAIEFDRDDWELQPQSGRITAFIRPRDLD